MKKFSIFLVLIFLMINSVSVTASSIESTTEDTMPPETTVPYSISGSASGIDATSALLGTEKLVNNVRAAALFEANSQTMLYAWNADTQMHPASFVKIMTALIAIEEGNLSDLITVKQSTINSIPYDAVSAKLVADETISLNDLLYCMIVGSANDAAAVIAEHIAGSHEAFVDKMNAYAQTIGCTGTHFVNAHGLHNENQLTTARDTARIIDYALKNETFNQIFTTIAYDVSATNKTAERSIATSNSMTDAKNRLYYDARVKGGRTGVTQDGRRIIATVSEFNGMRVIAVVMGSESVYQEDGYTPISIGGYNETSKLLERCYKDYKAVNVLYPNQVLRQVPISSGNNDVAAGPKENIMAVLPQNWTADSLVFRYTDKVYSAPVQIGQCVSDVQVWAGNVCVAQASLYALNSVEEMPIQVVKDQKSNTDGSTIVVVLLLVVLLVGGFIVYRQQNAIKYLRSRKRTGEKQNSRRRH